MTAKKKTARRKRANRSENVGKEEPIPKSMRTGMWQNEDGTHKGRQAGTPNKSTVEIRRRLEELKCDPLEYAVMFLRGDETPCSHPFLAVLKNFVYQLRRYKKNPPPESIIAAFELKANEALGPGTWLDPKIRAKLATDLLAYVYPRLQSVEYKNPLASGSVDPQKPVHELSDDELRVLAVDMARSETVNRAVDAAKEKDDANDK